MRLVEVVQVRQIFEIPLNTCVHLIAQGLCFELGWRNLLSVQFAHVVYCRPSDDAERAMGVCVVARTVVVGKLSKCHSRMIMLGQIKLFLYPMVLYL